MFGGDLFNPKAKDTDLLLEYVFKPLFGWGTDNPPVFGEVMQVFIIGLLLLATVMMTYNTLMGTTDTSNSGKVLGGKSSLTWSTVRNVTGMACLIPVKGGLCLIQWFMIYLASQSVLFSNYLLEKVDFVNLTTGNVKFTSGYEIDLLNTYQKALFSHTCLMLADEYAHMDSAGKIREFGIQDLSRRQNSNDMIYYNTIGVSGAPVYRNSSENGYNQRFKFGQTNGGVNDRDLCGEISISYKDFEKQNNNNNTAEDDFTKRYNILAEKFRDGHIKAMNDLIFVKSKETAQLIMNNKNKDMSEVVANKIVKDINDYEKSLKDIYNNEAEITSEEIKKTLNRDGVVMAGGVYFRSALLQQQIDKILKGVPLVSLSVDNETNITQECDGFFNGGSWFDGNACRAGRKLSDISDGRIVAEQQGVVLKTLEKSKRLIENNETEEKNNSLSRKIQTDKSNDTGFLKLFQELSDISNIYDPDSGEHPLVELQKLGSSLLNVATLIYASLLGSSLLSALPIIGGLGQTAAMILMPISLLILGLGFTLAYFIPFLPTLIWLGSIISWIISVIIAIIGLPLFMLTFMKMEDSFIGRSGAQILAIVEVTFRLPIMVLVLYFSLLLIHPILTLTNAVFSYGMSGINVNVSALNAIWYLLAVNALYCILAYKVIRILINIIETVPEKIFQWLGTALSTTIGNIAASLDNDVEGQTKSMFSQTHQVAQGLQQAAGMAGRSMGGNGPKGGGGDKILPISGKRQLDANQDFLNGMGYDRDGYGEEKLEEAVVNEQMAQDELNKATDDYIQSNPNAAFNDLESLKKYKEMNGMNGSSDRDVARKMALDKMKEDGVLDYPDSNGMSLNDKILNTDIAKAKLNNELLKDARKMVNDNIGKGEFKNGVPVSSLDPRIQGFFDGKDTVNVNDVNTALNDNYRFLQDNALKAKKMGDTLRSSTSKKGTENVMNKFRSEN